MRFVLVCRQIRMERNRTYEIAALVNKPPLGCILGAAKGCPERRKIVHLTKASLYAVCFAEAVASGGSDGKA